MPRRLPDGVERHAVRFTIKPRTASSTVERCKPLLQLLLAPPPKRKVAHNTTRKKLAALKKRATLTAEELGHDLRPFRNAKTMACAFCRTCEAWVQVDVNMNKENSIVGPAVANKCR